MKKILVPTDFSSFADNALKVALGFARRTQAEIVLLNVILAPSHVTIECSEEGTHLGTTSDQGYFEQVIGHLQDTLRDIIQGLDYEKVSYQIRSGNITQAIMAYVENNQIDMIVMGTQGDSNYDALFVGSNAEKVVQLADCPVITIRNVEGEVRFDDIVFATDLMVSKHQPIDSIKQIQALYDAKLHLVYVNTPGNFQPTFDLNQKAESFVDAYSIDNYNFYIYCDFVEDDGINHFAEEIQADLILVVSHKRRGFARLLAGSIAAGVVTTSNIPVLTFSLKS
ncbi:MAG: universal stress protein [Microscillaceae bacterium]|nr:universal stress protein [Microscillaceae bacterium]